jgi:hypothetical protein
MIPLLQLPLPPPTRQLPADRLEKGENVAVRKDDEEGCRAGDGNFPKVRDAADDVGELFKVLLCVSLAIVGGKIDMCNVPCRSRRI